MQSEQLTRNTMTEQHDPTDRKCRYHHPGFVEKADACCWACVEGGTQRPW